MILRSIAQALETWIEEAELIHAAHPPAIHLLTALRQGRITLAQLIERGND